MHRAVSGGFGQAGRVLEFVDERLEQENRQKMSQNVWPGGAFIGPWWPLQANQALQALEAELDPPSQAIEGKNFCGCKLCRLE